MWWGLSGLTLSLLGSVIAGRMLWLEFRRHRPGEPVIPLPPRLRRAVRRLLRRGPVTASVSGAAHAEARAFGHVTVQWLPDDADPNIRKLSEFLDELDLRLAQVTDRLTVAQERADRRAESLSAEVASLRLTVREVAAGSTRWELLGLVMVGVGSVLSAVPTLAAALAGR